MNKLILNSVSYIVEVANDTDEPCTKCALYDLPGGCCSPCKVFDHHKKGSIEGNCYFIEETEETEKTEKAKEAMINKKAEIAKKLYDVLGSLESCFDECPLNDICGDICGSPNTICDKLKDTAIAEY